MVVMMLEPPSHSENAPLLDLSTQALGSLLSQKREIVTTHCRVCDKEITGTKRRRFCSDRCRVRSHRKRSRDLGPYGSVPGLD